MTYCESSMQDFLYIFTLGNLPGNGSYLKEQKFVKKKSFRVNMIKGHGRQEA